MFRNNRAGVGGFPKRLPAWHLLDADTLAKTARASHCWPNSTPTSSNRRP